MSYKTGYIRESFEKNKIILNDAQTEMFADYYDLLIEENRSVNLTSLTELDDVVYKHFIDSVLINRYFNLSFVNDLIDVGTGAGFPGIPLKILYPQLNVTLLDSLWKRTVFLHNLVDKLGINDVNIIHGRAEDLGRDPDHRQQYDLSVSRAVAALPVLCEYCTPFIKTGGYFAAYKSRNIKEEIKASKSAVFLLGCEVERYEEFSLDMDTDAADPLNVRSFVFIKRRFPLSSKYPRRAGTPKKSPL